MIRIIDDQRQGISFSKSKEKLALGQVLKGKVLDVFSNGKAIIDLKGQKLSIETSATINKGQNIEVQVEQLSPQAIFKLILSKNKPNSALPPIKQSLSSEAQSINKSNSKTEPIEAILSLYLLRISLIC